MAITLNAPSQVRPYANLAAFPVTGAVKTIYIAQDTNKIYRWTGSAYVELSPADFSGYVPYTGATDEVDLGENDLRLRKLFLLDEVNNNYGSTHYTDGNYHIEDADGHKLLVIEDGFMQIHKTDTIQSNLYTSGLTATRNHYLPNASGTLALTSDLAGYVPTSRTITINGTTQDLSADRTFTISTGITIGTTPITSGTVGRVLFEGTGNVVQESANLFWDNTNRTFKVITADPSTNAKVFDFVNSGGYGYYLRTNSVSGQGNSAEFICNNFALGTIIGFTLQPNGNAAFGAAIGYAPTNYKTIEVVSTSNTAGGFLRMRTANSSSVLDLYTDTTEGVGIASNVQLTFRTGASGIKGTWFGTGNLLIQTGGTQTDAGFKLDVNGTARVSGNFYFGTAGSYLLGDTNNIRLIDKNNTIILQAFPNGVSNSETYLRSASGNFSFLRLRDDYVGLEYAVSSVSATAQNPIQINRGYFGNVLATDKSVLYVKSTLNSNLSNATTLRGVYIDINDTTTYTGFSSVRAIEAPRGGAYFNTTSVNASAVLQADSTTQGFLCPRMTTTQKNAIASPAEGLQVWDTTLKLMFVYNGTTWISL